MLSAEEQPNFQIARYNTEVTFHREVNNYLKELSNRN